MERFLAHPFLHSTNPIQECSHSLEFLLHSLTLFLVLTRIRYFKKQASTTACNINIRLFDHSLKKVRRRHFRHEIWVSINTKIKWVMNKELNKIHKYQWVKKVGVLNSHFRPSGASKLQWRLMWCSISIYILLSSSQSLNRRRRRRRRREWLALLLGQLELVFHAQQNSLTQQLHDPFVFLVSKWLSLSMRRRSSLSRNLKKLSMLPRYTHFPFPFICPRNLSV